jgi:diaminopimelate epimerase
MATRMLTHFTKMHGAGNDFIVLDARPEGQAAARALTAAQFRALADRRTGIGCDQLIVLDRAAAADVAMRIFNTDGTQAGACGNATRCVAMLLRQAAPVRLSIETTSGILWAETLPNGQVRVDMGAPGLGWREIPLAQACDTLHLPLPGDPAAASMGNPHATFFLPDLDAIDPASRGPELQANPIFPESANIGFARIEAPDRIRLRVWERGAGLTRACGSGACAALVNAHRRGLTGRTAFVAMDGGTLLIEWTEAGHVVMTGPVATAFHGTVDLSTYPA